MLSSARFPFTGQLPIMIYSMNKFQVPEKLAQSPLTVEELCQGTTVKPRKLERVLLALESFGFYQMDSSTQKWTNSESTAYMAGGYSKYSSLHLFSPLYYNLMSEAFNSLFSEDSAVDLFYKKGLPQVVQEDSEMLQELEDFAREDNEMLAKGILQALDLRSASRVLDVGGGTGLLLSKVLKEFPHLSGAVYEKPELLPLVRELAAATGQHIEGLSGDFLDSVPKGYDTLLLKHILKDFPDDLCVKLLNNCRAALELGGQLIIIDPILNPNSPGYVDQRGLDMAALLTMKGARGRTHGELESLLSRTGFRLKKTSEFDYISIINAAVV